MNTNRRPQTSSQSAPRVQRARSCPELWLYDELHARTIRDSGVLDPYDPLATTKYRALAKQGVMVGYHLGASQSVAVSLRVGDAPSVEELGALHGGRWLAPLTALLDAPSGRLGIESRDRLTAQPGDADIEPSALLTVAPGRYRLTLFMSAWFTPPSENTPPAGRHQVVVLTPGGSARDAADHVLFHHAPGELGGAAPRGPQFEEAGSNTTSNMAGHCFPVIRKC